MLAKTLEPPPDGSTHWSVRRLAAATGISPTTVHRIWRDHKLKPHQVRSFKFSNDPQLVEKVIDVVGLYWTRRRARWCSAWMRRPRSRRWIAPQPTLPMKAGQGAADDPRLQAQRHHQPVRGTGDRDWRGHRQPATPSTPTRSSSRSSISSCAPTRAGRCTSCWITPPRTRHPRSSAGSSATNACTSTSRPTGASWMNMVEIWFSILTRQQVRRGVYHDVPELIAAIEHYIEGYNQRAQPFVWTKTARAESSPRPPNNKRLQERCTSPP